MWSGRSRGSSRLWPWFSLYLKPKILPEEDLDLLVTESEAALERVSQRNCHSIVFCLQQKICVVERVDSNRTQCFLHECPHGLGACFWGEEEAAAGRMAACAGKGTGTCNCSHWRLRGRRFRDKHKLSWAAVLGSPPGSPSWAPVCDARLAFSCLSLAEEPVNAGRYLL